MLRFPEECPEWFMWTPKRGGTWGIDTDRDDVVAIRVADDDWPEMEHDVLLIVYAPSILSFCQMYLNEELGRAEALRVLNEELDGGGTTPGPWVLHRAEGDKPAWEIWATEVADSKAPPGRGHLIASRSLEAGEDNDSRKIAWIDANFRMIAALPQLLEVVRLVAAGLPATRQAREAVAAAIGREC